MKLIMENWRGYLSESLSESESECMALFSPGFNMFIDNMKTGGPDSVSQEIFDIVSEDVPNVVDVYMTITPTDIGKKMEFLKELMLEYVALSIAKNYERKNLDVEDYVNGKEGSWDNYKEKYPPWWTDFRNCIERGPGQFVPVFSNKRTSRKIKQTNVKRDPADTFVLEP